MGTIIPFPEGIRQSREVRPGGHLEDATVIILPSIRIERQAEPSADGSDPQTGNSASRPRGRRRSR